MWGAHLIAFFKARGHESSPEEGGERKFTAEFQKHLENGYYFPEEFAHDQALHKQFEELMQE